METDVTGRVELAFDPATYDAASETASVPVRLRNVSAETIHGPVRVEVAGLTGWAGRKAALEILGAANGRTDLGAVFDFTPALGAWGRLAPGEVSGPVVLKLRYENRDVRPTFTLKVWGRVEKKP